MSNSLQPHGLQHARLPCPSLSPGARSNSCPLSQWCHPTISSCHPLPVLPSIFPSIRVFSNELALRIRWPKYWNFSFNIDPYNEYSGFISFRIDCWSFCPRISQESFPAPQFKSINFLVLSLSLWSNSHLTPGKTTALTIWPTWTFVVVTSSLSCCLLPLDLCPEITPLLPSTLIAQLA